MAATSASSRRGEVVRHRQEPSRIRVGKRPQEDAVDDAEDRGVGADAERQRRHGDGGEAGVRGEAAQSVADVLQQCLHHSLLSAVIGSTRDARRAGSHAAANAAAASDDADAASATGSAALTP